MKRFRGDYIILSAPHNGTRSMRAMIGGLARHVYHDYIFEPDIRVVVPLRDPKAVWQSYCSRVHKSAWYGSERAMEEMYERLLNELKKFENIFYCPVDLGDRSAELSEFIGRDVEWLDKKVGHIPQKPATPKDLSWFYEIPFIKSFYLQSVPE